MNLQARIERFLLDDLLTDELRQSIDPDEPLISTGIIDSLGMLRLITFLEHDIGVRIADGEVQSENFETLNRISAFVEQKQRPGA